MAFLSQAGLKKLGFHSLGDDVQISDAARFYSPGKISIGSHVRIDDFCILSAGRGGISIGNFVHIGCFSSLLGSGEIVLADYSGLSARVCIYSSSDDYSGAYLTNPTVPLDLREVHEAPVKLGRHAIVGAGSVILPGVTLGEGVAVGALTLVARDLDPFTIYLGVPARRVGERRRSLLDLENP